MFDLLTSAYYLLITCLIFNFTSISYAIQCYTCSSDPRGFDHDYCRTFNGYNPYGAPPVFDCNDGACLKLDVLIKDEIYPRVYRFCDYHNEIDNAVSSSQAFPFGTNADNDYALTVDSSGRRQAAPPRPPQLNADFCSYPIESSVVREPLARLTQALSRIQSPTLDYISPGAPTVRGHSQPGVFGNSPPTYDPVIYASGQRYKRQAKETRAPAILLSPLLNDKVDGIRMCRCSGNYCNSATAGGAKISWFIICLLSALTILFCEHFVV